MLFCSYYFLFLFLPVVLIGYYSLLFFKLSDCAKIWLVIASLYFYSFFKISYLPIMIFSICINYLISRILLTGRTNFLRRFSLISGLTINLGVLFYFKYAGFVSWNLNELFQTNFPLIDVILPLGISFYTFQQLSYLIDSYGKRTCHYSFLDYSLFVTFFPQLIAGPIVLAEEMLPQFAKSSRQKLNFRNINIGLLFFSIGLAKKTFIADTLAAVANTGFDTNTTLTFSEAWLTTLSFTLQLYFDFSGYCDMAMGLAKFFNIDLPINFNSPYKASNFQDFWRRWHITLGRFMMNYLYIPLGGNRLGNKRTLFNLFIVFVISGIWHGAGWLFLIWGMLHGGGILVHRWWKNRPAALAGWKIPHLIAVGMTFFLVNILWVFFRSTSLVRAISILKSMFSFQTPVNLSLEFRWAVQNYSEIHFYLLLLLFSLSLASVFLLPNSNEIVSKTLRHPALQTAITVICCVAGILCIGRGVPFLYFNF